jgi:hypothetical protein
MKMGSALLFGRMCCGLSVAVLAVSVCIGASRAVRADDADDLTSSLQEMIVDPIMKSVHAVEEHMASLEASVSAMAESFSSRRVVVQMLCVSDDSGAQTCITKAQLDSLLSGNARADISHPSAAVKEDKAVPTEERPVETILTKDPARAPDIAGSADERPAIDQEPEHTGTVASSGAAIVSYPEVEVIVVPAPSAPTEAAEPSDD